MVVVCSNEAHSNQITISRITNSATISIKASAVTMVAIIITRSSSSINATSIGKTIRMSLSGCKMMVKRTQRRVLQTILSLKQLISRKFAKDYKRARKILYLVHGMERFSVKSSQTNTSLVRMHLQKNWLKAI